MMSSQDHCRRGTVRRGFCLEEDRIEGPLLLALTLSVRPQDEKGLVVFTEDNVESKAGAPLEMRAKIDGRWSRSPVACHGDDNVSNDPRARPLDSVKAPESSFPLRLS
jgi:hypothetical protein